jgi:hypothetical protein
LGKLLGVKTLTFFAGNQISEVGSKTVSDNFLMPEYDEI